MARLLKEKNVTALRVLFPAPYKTDVRHRQYTVSVDDQSFLFIKRPVFEARVRITTNVGELIRSRLSR